MYNMVLDNNMNSEKLRISHSSTSSEIDDVNTLLRSLGIEEVLTEDQKEEENLDQSFYVDDVLKNRRTNNEEISAIVQPLMIEIEEQKFDDKYNNNHSNDGMLQKTGSDREEFSVLEEDNKEKDIKFNRIIEENLSYVESVEQSGKSSRIEHRVDVHNAQTEHTFDEHNEEIDNKHLSLTEIEEPCDKCVSLPTQKGSRICFPRHARDVRNAEELSQFVSMAGTTNANPVLLLNCSISEIIKYDDVTVTKFMLFISSNCDRITIMIRMSNKCCNNLLAIKAIQNYQVSTGGSFPVVFYSPFTERMSYLPIQGLLNKCEMTSSIRELVPLLDTHHITWNIKDIITSQYKTLFSIRKKVETFAHCCQTTANKTDASYFALKNSHGVKSITDCEREIKNRRSTLQRIIDDSFVKNSAKIKSEIITEIGHVEYFKCDIQLVERNYAKMQSSMNIFLANYDAKILSLEQTLVMLKLKMFSQQVISWSTSQRMNTELSFRFIATTKPGFRRQQRNFDKIYSQAMLHYARCDSIVCDAIKLNKLGLYSTVQSVVLLAKSCLDKMIEEMESKKEEIITVSKLYHFVDEAYSWALNGMKFVASLSMKDCVTAEVCSKHIEKFDEYMSLHPPIRQEEFLAMQDVARKYKNVACEKQCEISMKKCQETEKLFHQRRELLEKARSHLASSIKKTKSFRQSVKYNSHKKESVSFSTVSTPDSNEDNESMKPDSETKLLPEDSNEKLKMNINNNEQLPNSINDTKSRHRPKKVLRKSASICGGVRPTIQIGSPLLHSNLQCTGKSKSSLAIEELIFTEHEYVQSLRYIVENYMPEMNRLDVPQSLRGKRAVIFGNIENITDFHCARFLAELRTCGNDPMRVAQAFLQHKDWFSLYALYSKNKPQSDAVMSEQGMKFFKVKQKELGDKMDLASYLLKPVQRMGKYALLLHNIAKHTSDSAHKDALQQAEAMVKFQLRHGNDLLAMDSIVDCEINLKEHGELLRQDQFILLSGRKKLLRHIFLLTDVIVICKPVHVHGGHDTYIYKHSYKTSEIGLTENIGEAGVKFEIWLRKSKNNGQSFVLQSQSRNIKDTWVSEIRQLLWRQALKNKENRRSEMLSMGVGSKPFLDLQSSMNPITERSVSLMNSNILASRMRGSIAVGFHDNMPKRPHSLVSTSSTSSNGSSLVPSLNLASQQPNSYLDFQAILEDAESESDSARSSSMCTSHTSHDDATQLESPLMMEEHTQPKNTQSFANTCLVK